MLNIEIRTIKHEHQRYPTVGDWFWTDYGKLIIYVSDMGNEKYELLVAIHEMIETILCKEAGIKEEYVTAFDKEFEKNRPEGNTDEPGDDPAAPYKEQHRIATQIEGYAALQMGINWSEYDKTVNSL